jgi:hypothetical protein
MLSVRYDRIIARRECDDDQRMERRRKAFTDAVLSDFAIGNKLKRAICSANL